MKLQRSFVDMRGGWPAPRTPDLDDGAAEAADDPALQPDSAQIDDSTHVVCDEAAVVPLGVFVVSVHRHTRFRRLHFTGSCSYRPGWDARHFELLGDAPPSPSHFDARCKHCFKDPRQHVAIDADTASSSGSSSEVE